MRRGGPSGQDPSGRVNDDQDHPQDSFSWADDQPIGDPNGDRDGDDNGNGNGDGGDDGDGGEPGEGESERSLLSFDAWQKAARGKVGAGSVRERTKKQYHCAHCKDDSTESGYSGHDSNCSWTKKRVTILAYIKHLKDRHQEDVRKNAYKDLLPVPDEPQPSPLVLLAQDTAWQTAKNRKKAQKQQEASLLIIDDDDDDDSSGMEGPRRSNRIRHLRRPNYRV